jgi:ribosome recycling factor
MIDINSFKQTLQKTVTNTSENLATIRTGRATSALIENIQVKTYGGQATLKIIELATISNSGPQELLVAPFDPSTLQDIEAAVRASSMGFIVAVTGNQIRVKAPPLSEEQRQKYTKLVSQFSEEGREAIRRHRDAIRKELKDQSDSKEISDDQKYRLEQEIDKVSKEYTEKIDTLRKSKEEEVLTI